MTLWSVRYLRHGRRHREWFGNRRDAFSRQVALMAERTDSSPIHVFPHDLEPGKTNLVVFLNEVASEW